MSGDIMIWSYGGLYITKNLDGTFDVTLRDKSDTGYTPDMLRAFLALPYTIEDLGEDLSSHKIRQWQCKSRFTIY